MTEIRDENLKYIKNNEESKGVCTALSVLYTHYYIIIYTLVHK